MSVEAKRSFHKDLAKPDTAFRMTGKLESLMFDWRKQKTYTAPMTYFNRIEINPRIMMGKPVVKGTRIPVYVILNLLAEGNTERAIRKDYPDITREDIVAILRFAASMTRFEEMSGKLSSVKVKVKV